MGSLIFALFFLVNAVLNFMDSERFGGRDIDLEEEPRKQYRMRVGIAYACIAIVAFCIFMAEFFCGIRFNTSEAFICFGIPYMIPLLYILYVNKRFSRWPWKRR